MKRFCLILACASVSALVMLSGPEKTTEAKVSKRSSFLDAHPEILQKKLKKVTVFKDEVNAIADRLTDIRERRNKIYEEVKNLKPEDFENPYYLALFQEMDDLDNEKLDLLEKMIKGMNEVSHAN